MGLFTKKGICSVCGKKQGFKTLMDGDICADCADICQYYLNITSWKKISTQAAKDCVVFDEEVDKRRSVFKPTKKVKKYFEIDEANKMFRLPKDEPNSIFIYNEIIDFELIEDGVTYSKGGLGCAITGGLLFGGVGAIVGANVGKKKEIKEITEFRIKIITQNIVFPQLFIDLTSSWDYINQSREILSLLTIICEKNSESLNEKGSTNFSVADEILKFKQLMDQGVISEDEFNKKKEQLLLLS